MILILLYLFLRVYVLLYFSLLLFLMILLSGFYID